MEHYSVVDPNLDINFMDVGSQNPTGMMFPAPVANDCCRWNDAKKICEVSFKYHPLEGMDPKNPQKAKKISHQQFLDNNNGKEIKTFWGGDEATRPFSTLWVANPEKPESYVNFCCAATGMNDSGCTLCCIQKQIWDALEIQTIPPKDEEEKKNPYRVEGSKMTFFCSFEQLSEMLILNN